MFTKRKDHFDLSRLLPGYAIFDLLTFGGFSRCFLFGGGSSSKSSQSSETKDNSAVVEDTAINATDGGKALRDDALGVDGNQNRLNLKEQDFQGDAKIVEEGATNLENQFLGAGEELTIGDGNSFSTSDPEVSKAAIEAAGGVSGDAFDFARSTVEESFKLGSKSQDSITDTFNELIQFSQITQAEANELTRETNEVLSTKSSDADSAVSATLQKNILIGIALAGIVIAYRNR